MNEVPDNKLPPTAQHGKDSGDDFLPPGGRKSSPESLPCWAVGGSLLSGTSFIACCYPANLFRACLRSTQLIAQPRARLLPVALHAAQRSAQRLRGFLFGQAGKETALDDACLTLVHAHQGIERIIERREMLRLLEFGITDFE